MDPSSQFTAGSSSTDFVVDVELTISAKDLPNKDSLSKSDPVCIVYTQLSNSGWQEHKRTEVVQNSLNPVFATKIAIPYYFEVQQHIKFKIYDIDSTNPSLDDHDFLGEVVCTLGQIVSSEKFSAPLKNQDGSAQKGQLLAIAEEIAYCKEEVDFLFQGQEFKKSGMFSKPDPFLAIYKEDGTILYRSTHIDDSCNPNWPRFSLPMRVLKTKDGKSMNLILQCWNYNSNGSHKLMGETRVTTDELLENANTDASKTFALKDAKKKDAGKLYLSKVVVAQTYSFLDYVIGGTQLNCTIAIDFTGSNGAPTSPGSLHYLSPTPTLYERALSAVGVIIQDYDSDKQFPVLGFGAKIPPNKQLSHEFFVNLSASPFCAGVDGVIHAYRNCLPVIEFYGPTNFSPVIDHVARFAASHPNGDNYFILLILTDGEITDMQNTIKAIIEASNYPMSIIIVGIGNADFTSMNQLDGDGGLLTAQSGKLRAVRDIVQFVPFRNFLHQDSPRAASELARELLAEIPHQLESYMKLKNIKPKTVA